MKFKKGDIVTHIPSRTILLVIGDKDSDNCMACLEIENSWWGNEIEDPLFDRYGFLYDKEYEYLFKKYKTYGWILPYNESEYKYTKVKATELSKFMYPEWEEKDGWLYPKVS